MGENNKLVKCLVWDLDDTLWKGTLLENDDVQIVPEAVALIRELDRRGILNSIASRNDETAALEKLRQFGIADLFLYPQINWGTKHASVAQIARDLNIGLDTIAFIEDQPYERDEVNFSLPDVRCFAPEDIARLAQMSDFSPETVSDEAATRRLMYIADQKRNEAEADFTGPQDEFLATLGMVLTISPVGEGDLARAEELTVRTNQLNTTGRTFSKDELDALRHSPDHVVLVASLDDRYGSYGKIGLALVEKQAATWTLKLLLMSCRVMARGVGSVLLNHVIRMAHDAGATLVAEHVPNDRNRMMLVTLRFAGFQESGRAGEALLLRWTGDTVPPVPSHLTLKVKEEVSSGSSASTAPRPAPSASSG